MFGSLDHPDCGTEICDNTGMNAGPCIDCSASREREEWHLLGPAAQGS